MIFAPDHGLAVTGIRPENNTQHPILHADTYSWLQDQIDLKTCAKTHYFRRRLLDFCIANRQA
jgi:methylaspartate ammonia-lyase